MIEQLAREHHFVHEFMTTGEQNDALEKYKKFGQLLAQEFIAMCDEEKAEYYKLRKSAYYSEDKAVYAEGEAACDTIKYKVKHRFGVKR